MAQILTVTFNPAVDKSTTVPELIPEKKLRCAMPVFEPGGGGINVARAIHKLGGQAMAAYLAGGCTGQDLTKLLLTEGVQSIISKIELNTRENLVVYEESSGKQYRFGMPGPIVKASEYQTLINSIEDEKGVAYIVVSGSIPEGIPPGIFAELSRIANAKNARLIVDTSGAALKYAVRSGVYLIKPNLRELGSLSNQEKVKSEDAVSLAKEVIKSGVCEFIALSMGGEGAILISKDLELKVSTPPVSIKSTVGAGDSMLGGLVYSLSQGKSITEAMRYGVACGTAATLNPGTELCRKEEADRLYRLIIEK